ncbi:hypothetical protein SNE40_012465 [Patella caerulea]|uniref:Uncharacterized protein n=1 Tax=Patella caerulea TaxID=87958 RepID=A0AAN8JUI7_PATCE
MKQSLAEDIETDLNIPLFQPNDIKTDLLFQLLGLLSNNVDDGVLEHTFNLRSIKLDSGLWVYSPEEQIKNTHWCLGIYPTTNNKSKSMFSFGNPSETTIGVFYKGEDNIAVFCNFMVDIYLGTRHERHHGAQKKFKKGTEYTWPAKISDKATPWTIRLRMNRIDNAI